MQNENSRQSFANVRDRRESPGQFHAIGLFRNPGRSVWPLIGPSELIGDIGDAKEIDDRRDFDGGPEIGGGGRHGSHQRQVSTGGTAGRNNPVAIHLVLRAWSWNHCAALRTSLTAAGAGAEPASRYSTFATTMPRRTNGRQYSSSTRSLSPCTQPPP